MINENPTTTPTIPDAKPGVAKAFKGMMGDGVLDLSK